MAHKLGSVHGLVLSDSQNIYDTLSWSPTFINQEVSYKNQDFQILLKKEEIWQHWTHSPAIATAGWSWSSCPFRLNLRLSKSPGRPSPLPIVSHMLMCRCLTWGNSCNAAPASVGPRWGLKFCVSNKLSNSAAAAAALKTMLWESSQPQSHPTQARQT